MSSFWHLLNSAADKAWLLRRLRLVLLTTVSNSLFSSSSSSISEWFCFFLHLSPIYFSQLICEKFCWWNWIGIWYRNGDWSRNCLCSSIGGSSYYIFGALSLTLLLLWLPSDENSLTRLFMSWELRSIYSLYISSNRLARRKNVTDCTPLLIPLLWL